MPGFLPERDGLSSEYHYPQGPDIPTNVPTPTNSVRSSPKVDNFSLRGTVWAMRDGKGAIGWLGGDGSKEGMLKGGDAGVLSPERNGWREQTKAELGPGRREPRYM